MNASQAGSGSECGGRARPRLLLLGAWATGRVDEYQQAFPTVWQANSSHEIGDRVPTFEELDLIVAGRKVDDVDGLIRRAHTISFSSHSPVNLPTGFNPMDLPSTADKSVAAGLVRRKGEEYQRPAIHPCLRGLQRDAESYVAEGRFPTTIHFNQVKFFGAEQEGITRAMISDAAILVSRNPVGAICYVKSSPPPHRCFAWLPGCEPRLDWIRAIVHRWSEEWPESFPGITDWDRDADWFTSDEASAHSALESHRETTEAILAERAVEANRLEAALNEAHDAAQQGVKRLLTAQDDVLVSAVADALRDLGFDVKQIDEELKPNQLKREDLRLRHRLQAANWEAIVEVRGYGSSGGKTADLGRLDRFAQMYHQEVGRFPAKRFYIVNQRLELPPSLRGRPLPGATEDVEVFAQCPGLVVSTCDLFRLHRDRDKLGTEAAGRMLCDLTGVLEYPPGPSD